MAVPIDLLNNSESDEDFTDSEISFSLEEDESMEDESSESEITSARETETKRNEEEEFWIKYPFLKIAMGTIVAQSLVSEHYVYERAKLIGDDKAKELNEKGKALFLKELDVYKEKCEFIAFTIDALKSV